MKKVFLGFLTGLAGLLTGSTAWAGQSVVLTTGVVGNDSVRAQRVDAPCRLESSIHDWDQNPPAGHIGEATACGFDLEFITVNGAPWLQLYDWTEAGAGVCQIPLATLPSRFITYRFQHIPAAAGGTTTCEAWDVNGRAVAVGGQFPNNTKSFSYTGIRNATSNGACVSGTGAVGGCGPGMGKLATAYFRLYKTTVPVGSTPPTTAQSLDGCLVSWKFDRGDNASSLADSCSAGPYKASTLAGSSSFTATPGQDLVVAIAKTGKMPVQAEEWATWVSARVGYPNSLDCTNSYSQTDASAQVSCQWSVLDGPVLPALSNPSADLPSYTPTSFGTYTFGLTITDAASHTASTTLRVGAVAYDNNGVVIPSDPRVTEILGPMIAFGQNPWGYADERAYAAVKLQNEYFQHSTGLPHPTWMTNGQGTVSYTFTGIGPAPGAPGTQATGAIAASATTISIADAAKIPGLAMLPDWITLGSPVWGYGGKLEMVRICGASATTGPATLTTCYGGRGVSAWTQGPGSTKYLPPQDWPAGTVVGEYRVSGTGTLFASDPNTAICPGGAPGPPGPVTYSVGTVSIAGGSGVISGNSTTWTAANQVSAGNFIRIAATHGGGNPFVFWSIITSITDPTHMVVDVPLPSDVDPGPFSYKVIGFHYLSLDFVAPDGATQHALQTPAGCESETAMFATASHDIPQINTTTFSDVHYSYDDALGIQSAYGPNFYGSGLAALAFYLRSGWDFANTTHKMMDDTWVKNPEIGGGWLGGIPLLQGGGVVGAIASLVLDPTTALSWSDVRAFAARGEIGSMSCSAADTRDSSYLASWLTLLANYDPDETQRAKWKTALGSGPNSIYAREQRCKGNDNSWANSFLFSPNIGPLTVTNGSATVTGSGIPQSACYGVESGTVTVTKGSGAFTGQRLIDGNKITISGTLNGQPYTGTFAFSQTGGIAGTLAALWPGDSGTFPYVIENNDNLTTIAMNNADPQLTKNWACTWVDAGHVTLNRPWDGPSTAGTPAYLFQYNLAGTGQQPYMMGIKATQLRWASQNDDSSIAANFASLAPLAATWIHDFGYDPNTQGLDYGRGFQACEPSTTATPGTAFQSRTPGCNYGLQPDAVQAARVLSAEANPAIGLYYISRGYFRQARLWGDRVYGSLWGYCPYTAPGFYCDSNYVRNENSDGSLASYKWPGFFFGMGMAHQWPAVRTIANYLQAQSVQVESGNPGVTLPSGEPWNGIGAPGQSWRWEIRVHNRGTGPAWNFAFSAGPTQIAIDGTQLRIVQVGGAVADTIGALSPGPIPCCAGRDDVLIRLQRDAVHREYTLELCDTAGNTCGTATAPITAFAAQKSWEGQRISMEPGYRIAFARWSSGVVPPGTRIQLSGADADLGDWEFEGNLSDSSGHGLGMSGGAVSYVQTPTYPPLCSTGPRQTFRAGMGASLDGSASAALDGGPTLSYLWQQVPIRQELRWNSQNVAQPAIDGIVAGPLDSN
jgi:hypothetical protein